MNTVLRNELHIGTGWRKSFAVRDDETIRAFARSIKDENPVHQDHGAAQALGLSGIIAPGVMIIGFISSTIAEAMPGVLIMDLNLKFRRPLYAQSFPTVQCTVTGCAKRLAILEIKVDDGTKTVVKGTCSLVLPKT
jgi:acyl dehydratase